jgi:hypothetical protein
MSDAQPTDTILNPDSFESNFPTSAEPLPEPKPIKKFARFHKDTHIQIETRTAEQLPTDNTEDGSEWHEVDDHFPDGKHLIFNDGSPRSMTQEEHDAWMAEMTVSGAVSHVRNRRTALLARTDWTENAPLSDEKKAEWKAYRQALRDLPDSTNDYDVVWPTEPN